MLYQDLRNLGRFYLKRERPDHTLQSTALVHETWLRLLDQRSPGWANRAEFLSAAGVMIRRILVDYARKRNADKRGDGAPCLHLDAAPVRLREAPAEYGALADALADLSAFDSQKARVVELRFFVGLSFHEIGDALGVSVRTVHREWTVARAWLQSYLTAKE
jgi:RNA polymerase sigma factor (TIGR02999 family)